MANSVFDSNISGGHIEDGASLTAGAMSKSPNKQKSYNDKARKKKSKWKIIIEKFLLKKSKWKSPNERVLKKKSQWKGGAVAEWSKALLEREINKPKPKDPRFAAGPGQSFNEGRIKKS